MEGQREEYLSNRGHIHAMFSECLENTLDLPDSHLHSPSPPLSPQLPPTLDDECILPPVVNLCVPTFVPNTDFPFSLYSQCDLVVGTASPFAFPAVNFTTSALVSLVALYNALLNSGCTHHIIQDHDLFSNYIHKEISVGTTNCESLNALGTGDVDFRYPFGD